MPHHQEIDFTSVNLIEIDADSENRRLDNFLISLLPGVPNSHIYNLIRKGQVRINSARVKAGHRLQTGDRVRVPPVAIEVRRFTGEINGIIKEAMQRILFEDECLLVLDKPAGVIVHSGTRHNLGLIEALKMERKSDPSIELVHRLDKDTSGVLVIAKTKRALRFLQTQWRREAGVTALKKSYCSLLKGQWSGPAEMCVTTKTSQRGDRTTKKSRLGNAISYFSPICRYSHCVLVNIELHTGKSHQARLHALQIGQPIAGDKKYGDRNFNRQMQSLGLKRMFLHASHVSLIHPLSQTQITFEAQLPLELTAVIDNLNDRESSCNGY